MPGCEILRTQSHNMMNKADEVEILQCNKQFFQPIFIIIFQLDFGEVSKNLNKLF